MEYISHQFPQVFSSSRVSEVTLGTFSPCCFGAGRCFCYSSVSSGSSSSGSSNGSSRLGSLTHKFPQVLSSSKGSRSHVRHFFGAILGPGRSSVPCCFGAGRCFWYFFVSSSSSSNGSSRLVSLINSLRSSVPVELAAV